MEEIKNCRQQVLFMVSENIIKVLQTDLTVPLMCFWKNKCLRHVYCFPSCIWAEFWDASIKTHLPVTAGVCQINQGGQNKDYRFRCNCLCCGTSSLCRITQIVTACNIWSNAAWWFKFVAVSTVDKNPLIIHAVKTSCCLLCQLAVKQKTMYYCLLLSSNGKFKNYWFWSHLCMCLARCSVSLNECREVTQSHIHYSFTHLQLSYLPAVALMVLLNYE